MQRDQSPYTPAITVPVMMGVSFLNHELNYILPAVKDSAILSKHLEKRPVHRVGCCVFKKGVAVASLVTTIVLHRRVLQNHV